MSQSLIKHYTIIPNIVGLMFKKFEITQQSPVASGAPCRTSKKSRNASDVMVNPNHFVL